MTCEVKRGSSLTDGNCPVLEGIMSLEKIGYSCLKIFIEGPQGSGKSTLTQTLSEFTRTIPSRGFPSSSEILFTSAQAELCRRSQEMSAVLTNGVLVFDRSPISQFVFLFRNTGDSEYLICAEKALRFLASPCPVMFIFIESDVQACLSREDSKSMLKNHFSEAVEQEVKAYKLFYEHLQKVVIPNVQVASILNGGTTDIATFFHQGTDLAMDFIADRQGGKI